MVRDEAPAATRGGINEIGEQFRCCGNPSGRQTSSAAYRTATYKLRATTDLVNYRYISDGSKKESRNYEAGFIAASAACAYNMGTLNNHPILLHRSLRLPAADLKRRQMAGDIAGVGRRPGKGADGVRSALSLALVPHGGVVEVGPEHAHGGLKRVRPQRRLPPAHHLGVQPGGLGGIGPGRALAPDQQIAAALAPLAVRRHLQP